MEAYSAAEEGGGRALTGTTVWGTSGVGSSSRNRHPQSEPRKRPDTNVDRRGGLVGQPRLGLRPPVPTGGEGRTEGGRRKGPFPATFAQR